MPSSSGAFTSFRVASFSRSRRPSRAALWYLSFMAQRQFALLGPIPSVWTPPPWPPAMSVDAPVGARCSPLARRSASVISRDACTVTGGEAVLLVAEGGSTVRGWGGGGGDPRSPHYSQVSCELRRLRRIIPRTNNCLLNWIFFYLYYI